MKISLIMATYNGQNFIENQLDSINKQTRRIDEVIIRDDGSTDDTVTIVKKFISDNQLKHWNLVVNNTNLGWRDNFSKLLGDATGDIIFLADQDDYWYPEKIKKMADYMENQSIEVLVSDYKQKILEGASEQNFKMISEFRVKDSLYKVNQEIDNYQISRPGWTYAVNVKLVPIFLNARRGINGKAHDTLIWQLALSRGSLFHMREVTGIWTMHPESAIAKESKGRVLSRKQLVQYLSDEISTLEILLNENDNLVFEKSLLRLKVNYKARVDVLLKGTLSSWVINCWKYKSFKTAIGDFKRTITKGDTL
ncbi:hypothetical protein FC71_GL000839 [Latilactobacillus sakei subsp. carnosus DSM 15831]|uniref:glycosyltransferase n=2 Tax=Latilactobacillus sakei TaxID=1599 RepID=UPI00019CEFAD|nr:glycosyltransferase [Latilactobacillus sakei]KRL70273.1 hypothetical protein FC71_GL000839 [Latilactobacillus sakei subsp. carnosus DSM 15831]GEP20910.1 glycosyl transferase family 2 [Latilactobacillus sakei subsp. carnosus]